MSLIDAYRLHISGSTFNQVAGHHNEYKIAGDLVQPQGENGITILQRNISGDAFYNSEQRFPPPQCHPDTRTAVQDAIQAWADEGHPAPGVMWLHGPAGAGKSAIAQSMAEKWSADDLAATFFFGRWRAGGSSGKHLFPTIAYQLALHIPQLRTPIGLAVEADPAICDKALEEQARALIVCPMEELDAPDAPYFVIIDGLDECEGKAIQNRIIRIIFRMLADGNLPIMFLICSRPEPHIRETFDTLSPETRFRRLVLDETLDPGRDILRYLRDSFREIQHKRFPNQFGLDPSWPSEGDLDRLVYAASGQFIYAATVVKFVDDEYSHPVEQLRIVLSLSQTQAGTSVFADLDALYTFILSANPNVSLLIRILGAYFAIPNPEDNRTHCVSFLDDFLDLPRGSVKLALRGLHSLLVIPDSDERRIRVHHASLQDFLFNPKRAGTFFLNINQHHEDLARRCFSIVQYSVENPEHYSSATSSYTHRHWMNHYLSTGDPQGLILSCLKCFQDSLEPTRIKIHCRDAKGMILRVFHILDFLETMDKYPRNTGLGTTHELNRTWETLFVTLFDPNPDILEFYEAWGEEILGDGLLGNPRMLIIHSSLELVLQKIWGTDAYWRCSRQRLIDFLNTHVTVRVRFRAAEIALRLLMCRSAEIKMLSTNKRPPIYSRITTHWQFASQWCRLLIDSPPVAELFTMLRGLLLNSFWTPSSELEQEGLMRWLKNFGDEAKPFVKALEACELRDGWVRIGVSHGDPHSAPEWGHTGGYPLHEN
ncbi:hypothetical protein DFH09DRAFT_198056 [Mycena vulgaris]|nr:hypothetical protein DFH09DRAFT_198056 [Mycena vulgaris]